MMSNFIVVGTIVLFVSAYVANTISLQRFDPEGNPSENHKCPSLFVAVLSSLESFNRRNEIRSMWQSANLVYGNTLKYKFALCTTGDLPTELRQKLSEEKATYDDTIHMDCSEGYLNGLLTHKVATTMRHYLSYFGTMELYMKIDDDTYISLDRLCAFMAEQEKQGIDITKAYMGVFAEGHEIMSLENPVIRDETSPWYEPYSKYPLEKYPVSAKGGPGYILPRASIQEIMDTNIANDFELNNEDKAIGYWVTKLKFAKITAYVNLPGTDGYEEHEQFNHNHNCTRGAFGSYPLLVHHHLEGSAISCLHDVEFTWNPNATIDACFEPKLFAPNPVEHVRIHMLY